MSSKLLRQEFKLSYVSFNKETLVKSPSSKYAWVINDIFTSIWPYNGTTLKTHTAFCTVPLVKSDVRFFTFCKINSEIGND